MPDKTAADRKAEAEARKAEADAKAAEAAAAKADREREEWESELAKRAREAEQKRLIAEAEEKARKASQTIGNTLELQKLEADAKKSIAEADKATADAQRAQVSAFIPDFSKIEKGETTLKGDGVLLGSLLGPLALDQAAKQVVEALHVSKDDRVLVTTDLDLASTDAVYVEVVTALDLLTGSATALLAATGGQKSPPSGAPSGEPGLLGAPGAAAVAGAIASAAPGLISLFSANRTLSSTASTADTTAAVASVAGRLKDKAAVQIDDFVIVQGGELAAKEAALRTKRSALAARKLALEPSSPKEDEQQSTSVEAKLIGELITQIDAFLTSLHTSSGKRSPFATAALRQRLHVAVNGAPAFDKILFIQAMAGSADQLLNDRPLWLKDKVQLIGSVAIVYWLMDTATSNIVASGVGRGAVQINGKIGNKLELEPPVSLTLQG